MMCFAIFEYKSRVLLSDCYQEFLDLPPGSMFCVRGKNLLKLAESYCYDGVTEHTVVDVERGTLHHASEFFLFN